MSADRRTRRYKEAYREERRVERERGGKKPFYLTLDAEGKPYGPGKPAWIAQINKLAVGLDPSITHIRKQTHDSMCLLKDRLNENFEYSGDLNEDHLRALLGKVVTRKRTELLAMINNNRKQPLHVDSEVWHRLQKLASSKQRVNRTEHGRYANSCRRTFERIGSVGKDGVRQRLRELYRRSPDPDEVADKMQRDKGYGKTEDNARAMSKTRLKGCSEGFLEDQSRHTQSQRIPAAQYRIEEDHNEKAEDVSGEDIQVRYGAVHYICRNRCVQNSVMKLVYVIQGFF